jgi:hypothetical protein
MHTSAACAVPSPAIRSALASRDADRRCLIRAVEQRASTLAL